MRNPVQFLKPVRRFMVARPFTFFAIFLAALLGLIVLGQTLRAPEAAEAPSQPETKVSEVFTPSQGASVTVPAKVEKNGVVEVVALSPGIVTAVHVTPGRPVGAGTTLVSLTNDYGSGAAAIEKQIARNNAELAREIDNIDEEILKLREKEAGDNDALTDRQEDLALEELERENEQRRVTLKNSELSLRLAQLSDAVLYPKSLTAGRVQSVHVRPGEFVTAGTPLVTLSAGSGGATLEALVTFETALLFDSTREAEIRIGGQTMKALPTYFATSENADGLYAISFVLPDGDLPGLVEGGYADVKLPLRGTLSDDVLVPLDAVFRSNTGAWVFREEDGRAHSQPIEIASVYGNYARVTDGLSADARILLNRNLIEGEAVEVR